MTSPGIEAAQAQILTLQQTVEELRVNVSNLGAMTQPNGTACGFR